LAFFFTIDSVRHPQLQRKPDQTSVSIICYSNSVQFYIQYINQQMHLI